MPTDPEFEPVIQARFQVTLDDGTVYTDAIVLPRSEFDALSDKEIQTLRAERVTNWLKAIENAKNAPQPTDAEVEAELVARKQALVAQLASVDAELADSRGR